VSGIGSAPPDPNADSELRATDSAPAFPEPASSEPTTGGEQGQVDKVPQPPDGETLDLELISISNGGRAVARHGGRAVFVPFGAPGDLVRAKVYRNRKRYAEAEIVEVVRRSPERVEPECQYYGVCGGCQLQHMSYSAQLDAKRQVVADQLARIGGFRDAVVHPTLPSPLEYGYRNTVRFLPGASGALGYTDQRVDRFLQVDVCPIAAPPINDALKALQGCGPPGEHVRVRYSDLTGELLIAPEFEAPIPTGQDSITFELLGRRFKASAATFFQVNTRQAERLVSLALDRLGPLEGKTVLDAYCGAGAFTRFIAEGAARTIGIEESPTAAADARKNVAGLEVQVVEGRAEDELSALRPAVDLVLLDPPRAGCAPAALHSLLALAPERIVYVSCDPATLARDMKTLCSTGVYALRDVQPVDMFPQTYHIEAVAVLDAVLRAEV